MFYIQENDKIVLFDEDRARLEATLKFMPQYEGIEIIETSRPIVDGEFADTEEYAEKKAQEERIRLNMLSLTKREVFLALYQAQGITPDMLKAQISDPQALIEFEYANEYYRGNPLIDLIGQSLGYTSDDLDYLFENKMLPNKIDRK